jgi:hypothetical protein
MSSPQELQNGMVSPCYTSLFLVLKPSLCLATKQFVYALYPGNKEQLLILCAKECKVLFF